MTKQTAAEPAKKQEPGVIVETSMIGTPVRRRDPETLPTFARGDEPLPGKHQPIHVFTEQELAAVAAGTTTKEKILADLANQSELQAAADKAEAAERAESLQQAGAAPGLRMPELVNIRAPSSIEEISIAFLEWAIDYIGRDYPGVMPSLLLPDGGSGAPLLFIPIGKGGSFGMVMELRNIPDGMDPGTAARLPTSTIGGTLSQFSALGFHVVVANGDRHAQDLLTLYMQFDETQR